MQCPVPGCDRGHMSITHHALWAANRRQLQRRAETHLDDYATNVQQCADCPYRICLGRPCGQVDQ